MQNDKGKDMIKRITSIILAAIVTLSVLTACADSTDKAGSEFGILYEGANVSSVEILYGTADSFELQADVTLQGDADAVTWSSDDAGVVRVRESEGSTCTFSILKTGAVKITAEYNGASVVVSVKINKNQDVLAQKDVALTVDGNELSAEKVQLIMAVMYNQFVNTYGSYASYYGLDTSTGLEGLADQACDYSSDGTWKGYFLDEAVSNLQEMYALKAYADENGIELGDDENEEVQDALTAFEEAAAEEGYDDADKYAVFCFGSGESEAIYEWYLNLSELAGKVYSEYYDGLEYTDEEISGHYAEMGYDDDGSNDYATVSMRHILILAEADDEGEYSEEAIEAAHDKAEEIYQQWLDGEASEDSFAELANEYSDDSGSNTVGGLYENIYKDQMVSDINDYIFEERTPGDTTIIDYSGSYTGTHIVYFVGEGEIYSTYLADSDLRSTDTESWLSTLVENCSVEYGAAYDKI